MLQQTKNVHTAQVCGEQECDEHELLHIHASEIVPVNVFANDKWLAHLPIVNKSVDFRIVFKLSKDSDF